MPEGENLIDMEHCFLELIDPISLQPVRWADVSGQLCVPVGVTLVMKFNHQACQ